MRTVASAPLPAAKAEIEKLFQQGLVDMNADRLERAEEAFISVAQSLPDASGPYVNLALIRLRQDRVGDAEEFVKQALIRGDDNAQAHLLYGVVQRRQGKFKESEVSYKRALKLDERLATAHLNLAILYDLYLGQLDKAEFHYRRYLAMEPAQAERVRGWLADLKRRQGAGS